MTTKPRYYLQGADAGGKVSGANEVLMAIGRLQSSVDHLREDFIEERRSSAASRKAMYERTDELAADLARLKTDVGITGQINAQVREEVKSMGEKIAQHKKDVQVSVDDWHRIKNLGLGVTGVLAIGGLSVGALLTMGLDAFKAAMRQWLG